MNNINVLLFCLDLAMVAVGVFALLMIYFHALSGRNSS